MTINSRRKTFMLPAFGFQFSLDLNNPLLLCLNKLMNAMLRYLCWRDNFNLAGRNNDARIRGALAAPDGV